MKYPKLLASSLLGSNIFMTTLCSKICEVYSSLKVIGRVSHLYKTNRQPVLPDFACGLNIPNRTQRFENWMLSFGPMFSYVFPYWSIRIVISFRNRVNKGWVTMKEILKVNVFINHVTSMSGMIRNTGSGSYNQYIRWCVVLPWELLGCSHEYWSTLQ